MTSDMTCAGNVGPMETDPGDAEDAVARYLREQADRPLGDALLASGRTLAPFSQALGLGAENLLVKAIDALEAQDEDRATALVRRAVGLPFDEHEEVVPAAAAAHLMLFNLVTDVMEDSPDDDERWLDAALGILSDSDGPARLDVRDVLVAIAQDYDLTQNERRRLTAGIRGVEPGPELIDRKDLPPEEFEVRVAAIVRACRAYVDALDDAEA